MSTNEENEERQNELFGVFWPIYARYMRGIVSLSSKKVRMTHEELDDALLIAAEKLSWFDVSRKSDRKFVQDFIVEMEEAIGASVERMSESHGFRKTS